MGWRRGHKTGDILWKQLYNGPFPEARGLSQGNEKVSDVPDPAVIKASCCCCRLQINSEHEPRFFPAHINLSRPLFHDI